MRKSIIILIGIFIIYLSFLIFYTKSEEIDLNYKISFQEDGFNFLQNDDKSISIIDINLDKFGVSFGGVEKEGELFKKYYSLDFLNQLDKKYYAAINGQFFINTKKNENTGLSFPIKSESKIILDYLDNEIPKRTLFITKNDEVFIKEGYDEKDLKNENNSEVLVAFTPKVRAKVDANVGRSYIGLKNSKNIIFFLAKGYNQEEMNNIIKDYGINSENIIMLDGGPSAQFSTKFEEKTYYGTWKVPQFNLIYKK